jgi:hypothetical protein
MEYDTAKWLNAVMLAVSRQIEQTGDLARTGMTEDEFLIYREAVSKILADIWSGVLTDIYRNYPDLMPPEIGA